MKLCCVCTQSCIWVMLLCIQYIRKCHVRRGLITLIIVLSDRPLLCNSSPVRHWKSPCGTDYPLPPSNTHTHISQAVTLHTWSLTLYCDGEALPEVQSVTGWACVNRPSALICSHLPHPLFHKLSEWGRYTGQGGGKVKLSKHLTLEFLIKSDKLAPVTQ